MSWVGGAEWFGGRVGPMAEDSRRLESAISALGFPPAQVNGYFAMGQQSAVQSVRHCVCHRLTLSDSAMGVYGCPMLPRTEIADDAVTFDGQEARGASSA